MFKRINKYLMARFSEEKNQHILQTLNDQYNSKVVSIKPSLKK